MPESVSVIEIVIRCLIVYLFVFVMLRFLGKKEIGELRPFDLVLLLIISEATQNAMTGGDNSLSAGLIAIAALVGLELLMTRLLHWFPRLQKALEGTPTVLVSQGQILWKQLRKERLTEEDLLQACRENGLEDASKVRLAVLEVDGTISVIPKD